VIPSPPWHVRAYVALIITSGIAVLAAVATHWQCADPERFAVYLLLACLAGALKVRLPGMTGTYSLTFLFVLIGVVDLTFPEAVLIAATSMVVQCVWRPATRPRPVQVIFSSSAASIAASAACLAARESGSTMVSVQLILAAAVYFIINTCLVAGILAQVEHRNFRTVWSEWFRLALTYYLSGVVVAGITLAVNRHFGWMFSLLALPLMYLEYLCYRLKIAGERTSER
jgi:hypothetical protein